MIYNYHTGEMIADEMLPRGFDVSKHFFCLVCRQKAERQATSKEHRKILWFHDGRRFPCVKRLPVD